MIDGELFANQLFQLGAKFFAGVPDSLLSPLLSWITTRDDVINVTAANEGNSVALGIGYHLASGAVPVVYMQNSGLGNAVNPLVSLAGRGVYGVPMVLLVGWRGRPGFQDEPQHMAQGKITLEQLQLLDIPTFILTEESSFQVLDSAFRTTREISAPVAIVVPESLFKKRESIRESRHGVSREKFIASIIENTPNRTQFVATTGMTSRELYEVRTNRNESPIDFLTIGGMGHASSIAIGIAISDLSRHVVCLDGDGALLMHMGASAVIGHLEPPNFIHVLMNNEQHESVGGQPTAISSVNLELYSLSVGYKRYERFSSFDNIEARWASLFQSPGPIFVEVVTDGTSRQSLGRPKHSFQQMKQEIVNRMKISADVIR
jgi:phosphonopyruvate decarboxylase